MPDAQFKTQRHGQDIMMYKLLDFGLNAKDLAQNYQLKGRSIIKTKDFDIVAKMMQKQGYGCQLKDIKKVLWKVDRLILSFSKKSLKLKDPLNPLKGYGYSRMKIQNLPLFNLNGNHTTSVTFRRKGGYFGSNLAVSPEQYDLICNFETKFNILKSELKKIYSPLSKIKAENLKKENEFRIEQEKKQNYLISIYLKGFDKKYPETYKETATRFSQFIGQKIQGSIFHLCVKKIRR